MYFVATSNSIPNCTYGYKLGEYGGNFVEFHDGVVKFSYHKDFKLYKNNEILLSNISINGEELPNDIVEYNLVTQEYKQYQYDLSDLAYDVVINRVKDILLENIQQCIKLSLPKIVYTAGLDSSTLAYLAQHNGIDFTCVIPDKYKNVFSLPFKNIESYECQLQPEFIIQLGTMNNIKPGFYQAENNNLITGYYGDNTVLHHKELYHQTKHLCDVSVELYDLTPPSITSLLNSKEDIINAVKYINTQNYFRHWFDTFQILDPYRDPRLIETVLSLPLKDLIEQFGSAKIQKDIIKSMNRDWINNICEHKNDYSKF